MKKISILIWLVLTSLAFASAPKADLVLRHGRIYTMDAARSWAESVAVAQGKIVYAGPDSGIAAFVGPSTKTLDLQGRYAMPSFIDGHVHPLSAGISMNRLQVADLETKDEILDAIRKYAAAHPDLAWILGDGWSLPAFPNANPQKEWLDAISPDRPVLLQSADGHSVWANSKALELAKVTKDTPDPEGGRIERNDKGEPSGTLRESASDLVYKIAPKPTLEEQIAGLKKAVETMNGFGITGFNDASLSESEILTYVEADKRGVLTARVAGSMYADPEGHLEFNRFGVKAAEPAKPAAEDKRPLLDKVLDQVTTFKQWRDKYRSENFHTTTVKIFEDGVVEAGTAAMLQPYLDRGNDAGKLLWEPQVLNPFVQRADKEGLQIHFHAIGDRAVRVALDSLEEARKANGPRDARPFLAHIEVIDPADIVRFVKIGAIPCFQPLWAFEDSYITDLTFPKMAKDRWQWLYPMGSVAKTGAVLSMGSDWNVSSVNPLDGIEVAVTRRSPANEPDAKPALFPDERLTLAQGLAAYTIGSAYENFWERETGSLEAGKSADLIVLSDNPFDVAPEKISDIKVLVTLFKGKEVFRNPDWK